MRICFLILHSPCMLSYELHSSRISYFQFELNLIKMVNSTKIDHLWHVIIFKISSRNMLYILVSILDDEQLVIHSLLDQVNWGLIFDHGLDYKLIRSSAASQNWLQSLLSSLARMWRRNWSNRELTMINILLST